jgi:hypothetical protein
MNKKVVFKGTPADMVQQLLNESPGMKRKTAQRIVRDMTSDGRTEFELEYRWMGEVPDGMDPADYTKLVIAAEAAMSEGGDKPLHGTWMDEDRDGGPDEQA